MALQMTIYSCMLYRLNVSKDDFIIYDQNCIVLSQTFGSLLFYKICTVTFKPERIDWFIEDQAFLQSYDSAPRPPPPPSRQ